ncbi:MAG: LytTR family DNA-binding domain-containing protein [Bacteroidetes bacterium]|jgi:DNA-binding LytR/AlgR family response regulator|nr:LytTR family DNA-binding domain-containing protein [Bacteroidota bacterium]MDF1867727.1 LytTR family DNA-binding domain-containing protein [Saprospiraceae bacterium]
MINVIIVDDEPLAQDVIETYVEKMPELNLVQKCNNALEANEALKKHDIDLMFLDIQMPQLTGIDFLKTLSNPPIVIFTTAYPNYAIEGFELDALDYLLKPISLERFMKAANKAIDQIDLKNNEGTGVTADGEDFIFVKADKKLIKVKYSDILYIEGLKDYVIIRIEEGKRVITLQTMKSLESKLPANLFKRIHRSYIVGISKIDAVLGNMVEVTEKGQKKHLPVGKNYREELLKIINKNRL